MERGERKTRRSLVLQSAEGSKSGTCNEVAKRIFFPIRIECT